MSTPSLKTLRTPPLLPFLSVLYTRPHHKSQTFTTPFTNSNPHTNYQSTLISPHRTKNEFMSLQSIENLKTHDPFAEADDAGDGQKEFAGKQDSKYIHIRIQQRNGRKTLTTIQGIPDKYELKEVLKYMKKTFSCNGTIVEDKKDGDVIQLQGDQRKNAYEFMTNGEGLDMPQSTIKVHGF